jgi:hypothetical protein
LRKNQVKKGAIKMKSDKSAWKGIGAILFLVSMFSMAFNIIPLAAATEEATELTIKNPDGCTISGSTVYWTFEIIDPDKVASPGETVYFRMRITNLPESDVPLQLTYGLVSFDPPLPITGSWYFDIEFLTVPVGETYEGPFGHISWTNAVPIGYVQGGSMSVGVYYGSPSSRSVPYSVTISLPVDIDIKPGSFPNNINPNADGVIPVAILTTADFDASTVDPQTVALNGESAREKGKSGMYGSMEDVEGDGDLDLVVQIENVIEWAPDATEATLTGLTWDGIPIKGTDSVNIVPPEQ